MGKCVLCGKETISICEVYRFKKKIKVYACSNHIFSAEKHSIENCLNFKAIFEHFGENVQIEKLKEEMAELIEAIESKEDGLILEEMADVLLLIEQFRVKYELPYKHINQMIEVKINRTFERIASGYYE